METLLTLEHLLEATTNLVMDERVERGVCMNIWKLKQLVVGNR
jgi:hypothetical protein